ncbi:MAG: hypothetical protein ABSE82_08165 [Nitrososphaerales archaeon]|jgi:hypothetical protein
MPYEDALDWLEDNLELPLTPLRVARLINPSFVMGAENELVNRGIMEEPSGYEKRAIAEASIKSFGRVSRIRTAGTKGRGAENVPQRFTVKPKIERTKTFEAPKGKVIVVKRDDAGNIVSLGLADE